MIHLLILAVHLLATIAKLLRPGGVRAVVAESLLLKRQLVISSRARQRAPYGKACAPRLAQVVEADVADFLAQHAGVPSDSAKWPSASRCRAISQILAELPIEA